MFSRSLALAATLAGTGVLSVGACHLYVDDPYAAYRRSPPPPQQAVVVRPAPPPPPREPRPPQPPAPQPRTSFATAHLVVAPPAPPTPAATETASATPAAPSALPAASLAPLACLDTGFSPVGDCNAVKPADATCGHSSAALQKCTAYKTYFDAKVAALAVACVTSLSSRQVCDPSQPLICAKTALAQACADPSVVQVCQIAASSCKITPGECSALLSGLNESGQEAIAQCVAQGCPSGLGGCIDGLAKK
jgi:hypothetical protein